MPTAILQSPDRKRDGNTKTVSVTKTITHNSARLYHEGGRTYEYIGNDGNGPYQNPENTQSEPCGFGEVTTVPGSGPDNVPPC